MSATDSDDEDRVMEAVEQSPPTKAFSTTLLCRIDESASGDRVSLPASVLEATMDESHSVLTFSFTTPSRRRVFGSVRTFTEDDGTVGISPWMAQALGVNRGDPIAISRCSLPKGKAVTLRPTAPGLPRELDIRTVLEQFLRRTFACLTQGEILSVDAVDTRTHQAGHYDFLVEKVSPGTLGGILVIDVDVDVDLVIETPLDDTGSLNSVAQAGGQPTILSLAAIDGASKTGYIQAAQEEGSSKVFQIPVADEAHPWELTIGLILSPECKGDCELYGTLLPNAPTRSNHQAYNVDTSREKQIVLRSSAAPAGIPPTRATISVVTFGPNPLSYTLRGSLSPVVPKSMETDTIPVECELEDAEAKGFKQCANCLQRVPERSFLMHETFCLRNNKICERCQQVLLAKDFAAHWHCPDCPFVGTIEDKDKHAELEHVRLACPCGRDLWLREVGEHVSRECPDRIIMCPYCHLLVRAGPNVRSGLDLLTSHEESCRGRTVDCIKCGAKVKIVHVQHHARIHELERASRPPLVLCSNQNCDRPAGPNLLKLCAQCWGPFYSPNVDEGNKKLAQRIIRHYYGQLTVGCKIKGCSNAFCAQGRSPWSPNEAALKAVELGKRSALFDRSSPEMWLCVDGSSPESRAQKIADWNG